MDKKNINKNGEKVITEKEDKLNDLENTEKDLISIDKKKEKKEKGILQNFYIEKINKLEAELSQYKNREQKFKDELNKKYLEAIQKKSEEANLLLLEKEKQIEEKYNSKFEEERKFMYEDQFTELVNIISRMEKVINTNSPSEEIKNYLLGFKMLLTQFNNLLDSFNIKVISPQINEEFDSEKMESLEAVKVEGEKKNKIIEIFNKGYTLNGRVIKLAQVKVGI